MSIPKPPIKKKGKVRQHFVPQFYLRNFGSELHCFDKKTETKFKSAPENLAVKADFYGGEYEGAPSFEAVLSKIEERHSRAIKVMIEKQDYYKLTHDQKVAICEFLSLQLLRTEQAKNNVAHTAESLLNFIAPKEITDNFEIKLTKNHSTGFHLNTLSDYRRYAVLFFNMKFVLFLNKTPIPFWTSDNPITKQNEFDRNPFGNLGIINKGIEIHMPLTPSLCLYALDPITFNVMPNVYETFSKSHITRENFLQLKSSTRFVYSNTRKFHSIRDMLDDNPHFKDDSRSDFDIFMGNSKDKSYFITSERNEKWSAKGNKIMGKMQTWADLEFVEKVLSDKKYDG